MPRLADGCGTGLYLAEDDMNVGLDIAGCPGGMDGIHIATSQDGMNLCDSAVSNAYLMHVSLQLKQVIGSIFVDVRHVHPLRRLSFPDLHMRFELKC